MFQIIMLLGSEPGAARISKIWLKGISVEPFTKLRHAPTKANKAKKQITPTRQAVWETPKRSMVWDASSCLLIN